MNLLLSRSANKEHRNVSDYTPLSLAASGGYVNIIKLLLNAGAEINSRTGSKLGISPLMLAAMNGHTGQYHHESNAPYTRQYLSIVASTHTILKNSYGNIVQLIRDYKTLIYYEKSLKFVSLNCLKILV